MSELDLPRLRSLDLFAGYGGITRALEPWGKPVAYCEIDRYCQAVLLSEMWRNKLPTAPIWDDVRTLQGDALPRIDLICGGFPCQDLSCAGRGAGLAGERSGLFFEIVRLAKETGAPFLFLENVPAIRTRGLREVIRTLTEVGYDCRWTCVSAASVGAPHKRERWFLLAYADRFAIRAQQVGVFGCGDSSELGHDGQARITSDANESRLEGSGWQKQAERLSSRSLRETYWQENSPPEPTICRMDNGARFRVDRLRALGNGVVPLQARQAFKILMGLQ